MTHRASGRALADLPEGGLWLSASRPRSLRLGVWGHSPCPACPALSRGAHTGHAGAIPIGPRSVTARPFPPAAWAGTGADGDLQVDTGVTGTKPSAWQPRLEVTGGVIILQKVLTIIVSLNDALKTGGKWHSCKCLALTPARHTAAVAGQLRVRESRGHWARSILASLGARIRHRGSRTLSTAVLMAEPVTAMGHNYANAMWPG